MSIQYTEIMTDDLPKIIRFEGIRNGVHLLVLGQIHGTEPCGRYAIERVIHDLETGKKKLKSGKITFVPMANPRASATDKRFIEDNLNRVFEPHENPDSYEKRLANYLVPLFHEADVILDIHSTMAPTLPYVFARNDSCKDWIGAMNVPYIVKGWDDLYPPDGSEISTEGYAARIGKICLTVECGQNKSKEANKMAYRYLTRTLRFFDLMTYSKARFQAEPQTFKLKKMYRKTHEGHLSKPWKNFSGVRAGTALFQYSGQEPEIAPYDATIFLPKANADIGWDWLYLAQKE